MKSDKSRHQIQAEKSATREAVIDKALEGAKKRDVAIRKALDGLLLMDSDSGRVVLKYLYHLCGFNRSSIAVAPATGEVQTIATQHNEAMRLVYI